eukprot:1149474-Pelagomonas_calceolata.AAC.1
MDCNPCAPPFLPLPLWSASCSGLLAQCGQGGQGKTVSRLHVFTRENPLRLARSQDQASVEAACVHEENPFRLARSQDQASAKAACSQAKTLPGPNAFRQQGSIRRASSSEGGHTSRAARK